MSIETRARTAGENLRASATATLDLDRSLDDLTRTARHRRWMQAGAVVAAATVAAVAAGFTVAHMNDRAATPPSSNSDQTMPPDPVGCSIPGIACGAGTVTAALPVPVTWHVTKGFGHDFQYRNDPESKDLVSVEPLQNGSRAAGVAVNEDVRAVRATRLSPIDHRVEPTAEALASWVAHHPWLDTSALRRTTVSGMPAWTVSATLRDQGRQLPLRCNGMNPCLPMLAVNGIEIPPLGIWQDMSTQYTFVDVDGAGPTVIWSWSFGGPGSMANNQRMIDTIQFDD